MVSSNKARFMTVFVILAMLFSFVNVSPAAAQDACTSSGSPVVRTDKADYGAFDTATISGSGFGCGEVLSVKVTAPDGSSLAGDGTGSPGPDVVITDGNGDFSLSYALSGTILQSLTSDADGAYAGQSGTYTIEVISTADVVLASSTFTDQSQLANSVPASVIVTYNGMEWVWASPCAQFGCTSGILIGKDGFVFATQAQWALRPPPIDFFSKCAAPWFDLTHNHCDASNLFSGELGSAPRAGLPAGISGLDPMVGHWETLLVRVSNQAPTANAGGPYGGNEGSAIAMSGAAASDPNAGDTLTYAWTVNSALCSFSDSSILKPNLTCTDNGNFTAKLTVSDSVNPPVTSDVAVTVDNVAPTITGITTNTSQTLTGTQVTFTGSATDPSSDDMTAGFSWQWSVDAGPYTPFGGPGANTFSVSFLTCGTHVVTAQASDKDLGVSNPFASSSVSAYEAHFLQPLDEGAYNLVQKGRVVPVKISIGCNGVPLMGLAPAIQLLSGDQTAGNETVADEIETFSASAADTTGIMRPADSMYIYNLQVPSTASAGALFTIRVRPFGTGADLRVILKIRR